MSWESLREGLQRACVKTFALDLDAVYRPATGAPYPVRVIFRDEHASIDVTDGARLETLSPLAHVRRADLLAEPEELDELFVPLRAATYQVRRKWPDGEGMVELELRRIDP